MTDTASQQALRRAQYLTGLMWHIGSFAVLNAFFWLLDLMIGASGLQWAYWITLFWGVALAFHIVAYLIDGRGVQERKMRQYLAEEQRRTAG
jgi:hypothetical protein